VSVVEIVPYEMRLIAYYATAFHTLTAPADPARSMHPDRLERDNYSVGFNPFNDRIYHSIFQQQDRVLDFFGSYVPHALSGALGEIIVEYYTRLAADQGKSPPLYFAEKNNNLARIPRDFARIVFGDVKEIVLYRDPRDLYCSHKSYFQSDSKRAMADITSACHNIIEILEDATSDLLAMSYEDLVRRPAYSLRNLSEFLGFQINPPKVHEQQSVFQRHGTSETPLSSIGRWKSDMSPDEKTSGNEIWQEFLGRFGYL